MAATSSSNYANILKRVYTKEDYFVPFEQSETPFLSELVDGSKDQRPDGAGFYFSLRLADAHATGGASSETAVFPDANQPTAYQGTVNASTQLGTFAITEKMMELGKTSQGAFNGSILNDQVTMTTRNLLFEINRQLVAGHGTGRMGTVETGLASATFVAAQPEGALQFRPGQLIAQYDLDTGGTQSGATVKVLNVDYITRSILTDTSITWVTGYSIYRALSTTVNAYGAGPNGLRNIADNGTLTTTLFGLTRSTTYGLNAQVVTSGAGGSGTQPFSEALVRNALARAGFNAGTELDEIWMNLGIAYEHLNEAVANKVFMITGASVPDYPIGYNKANVGGINMGGRTVPYRIDKVYPAREFTAIKKGDFRKHILRDLSWLGDDSGPGGSEAVTMLRGITSSSYNLTQVACQAWLGNISYKMPKNLVRVTEIADNLLAGDV